MSYCSCPKQIVGQKRLRPADDTEDDNQVKEEEDVEKKKAKFSNVTHEQSMPSDPGKEPCMICYGSVFYTLQMPKRFFPQVKKRLKKQCRRTLPLQTWKRI